MNWSYIHIQWSAIDDGPRSATIYALEDCIVAMAPKEVFLTYMRDYSDVLVRLMIHFVTTIRTLNERVVGLSSTTVVQRVYEQLLNISAPLRNPVHSEG